MADFNEEINNKNNINTDNKEDKLNPCRCPKCYLIPSIMMYEEENKLKLSFKCVNNHEFKEEINNLYNKSKIDIDNVECKICNNKKLKNRFYLCSECNNFYWKKYKNENKKENNNHLCININKCDSRCKIHNKDLIRYCEEYKNNIVIIVLNYINVRNIMKLNINIKLKKTRKISKFFIFFFQFT
jgi:hypothetical protein